MVKTVSSISKVPRGADYIKVDFGNEYMYIYGFENKAYIEIKSRTSKSIMISTSDMEGII